MNFKFQLKPQNTCSGMARGFVYQQTIYNLYTVVLTNSTLHGDIDECTVLELYI